MKLRTAFSIALFATLLGACSLFPVRGDRENFIRVRGTQFVYNGQPYYFAGTNLWHGCYMGSTGPYGDRPRLVRELDSLAANGLTNLRLLAASEATPLQRSVGPPIQRAPGVLDETLLEGLDFLLAEMAERRMHAVLFLNNYWEWSGGMAQYNVWAEGVQGVDPDDTTQGYGAFMNFAATFYANPKANALYRNYVRTIISRKNTVNGRRYSEDPTIMAWQLANEPRPGTNGSEGEQTLPAMYRWVDETAAYIHSLDTNHLVSAGSEGTVAFRWSTDCYLRTHRTPHIDYLTFHLWPKNWGWFDPTRFEETLPVSETNALLYVQTHVALARELRRPIVMEEFGLARDNAQVKPGSPATARDRYYARVLTALYDSARAGGPVAGSNFWAWGGEGTPAHEDGLWREGDPFLGDPPREPQGFNSIFLSDRSTLDIIRNHARAMQRLGNEDTLHAAPQP